MDTGAVQTKSYVGQKALTKDNAEIEHGNCMLPTQEGTGEIPELMDKIFEQIIKKHPSLSLIDLIAAIQRAKPVHAAASALKEPLKKMASKEGSRQMHELLDKMVEEFVTKIASEERNRHLHDMLDKIAEQFLAKHPSIALIELVSSLQKAKPVHTAATALKKPLKKMSSKEGSRQMHELLDKMVEEFVTKHPSIAVMELISSLQQAKPVHAAAGAVRGLSRRQRRNTTV